MCIVLCMYGCTVDLHVLNKPVFFLSCGPARLIKPTYLPPPRLNHQICSSSLNVSQILYILTAFIAGKTAYADLN